MRYFQKIADTRRDFIMNLSNKLGKAVGEARVGFKDVSMTRREFLPLASAKLSITAQKWSPTRVATKGILGVINEVGTLGRFRL